jgi:hypothetical protein
MMHFAIAGRLVYAAHFDDAVNGGDHDWTFQNDVHLSSGRQIMPAKPSSYALSHEGTLSGSNDKRRQNVSGSRNMSRPKHKPPLASEPTPID